MSYVEGFKGSFDARKVVLAGISLALYWAASLIVVSSYALAVHEGRVFAPVAGFAGLMGALVTFGICPRAVASRLGGRIVRVATVAAPLAFGAVVAAGEAGVAVPLYVEATARVLLGAALGCVLAHMGPFLAHCDRLTAAVVSTVSFFAGALVYLSVSSLGVAANPAASALLALASGGAYVLAGFDEHSVVHGDAGAGAGAAGAGAGAAGSTGAGAGAGAGAAGNTGAGAGAAGAGAAKSRELPLTLPQGFWPLSIGLFLYSAVYGIVIALTLATGGGFAHTAPVALSLLAPGLILFALLARFQASFDFRRFQWFLFVPSVIGLLPLPFAGMQTGLLLCGVLIMVFSFYDLASFVLLVDLARDREPALAMRVFAWGRAANVAGISAGWAVAKACFDETLGQGSDGFIAAAYIAVATLVVLMTFFGNTSFSPLHQHDSANMHAASGGEAPPALDLDAKCEIVAAKYGLSTREAEVFRYLAHGRSTAHIADALCVSQSTVKTHAYRIYRKLDVHSQQDVIDLAEKIEG